MAKLLVIVALAAGYVLYTWAADLRGVSKQQFNRTAQYSAIM